VNPTKRGIATVINMPTIDACFSDLVAKL